MLAGRYLMARSATDYDGDHTGFATEQSITGYADASDGNAKASSDVTSPIELSGKLAHDPDMFVERNLQAASVRGLCRYGHPGLRRLRADK